MIADSNLVNQVIPAYEGNYTKNRSGYGSKIEKITIHHCAMIVDIETLGSIWQRVGRDGSSHYGVKDYEIGQFVSESDIAWTDGNWESNKRSVTIETSNNSGAPYWTVSDESLETLIKLCADIAKRNNLGDLVVGENLTWHSMYSATECPGDYLRSKMQYIADKANEINKESDVMFMSCKPVRMDLGYMSGGDLARMGALLDIKDIDYTIKDGHIITTPAVSKGDQPAILAMAVEMGIDYVPYCSCQDNVVSKEEYDAVLAKKDFLEKELQTAEFKINKAKQALN